MKLAKKSLSAVACAVMLSGTHLVAQEITEVTGLDQIGDIIASDAYLNSKVSAAEMGQALQSASAMNALIKEAVKARGLANDGSISVADTREINRYLYDYHLAEWYDLRGQEAGADSTGYYLVDRRLLRSETRVMNRSAGQTWGEIYNLGFQAVNGPCEPIPNYLTDYAGAKSTSFREVGYALGEIMKNDIAAGTLYNPDVKEVSGTTGTALDTIVESIMHDEGLTQNISTGDMRSGSQSADAMNRLIIEAIIAEGLGNDGKLTAADVRQINSYLVRNHKEEWAALYGSDGTAGEKTGYNLVKENGGTARMFADTVADTLANAFYNLGFETDTGDCLSSLYGARGVRFEKVAWWLDTMLRSELETGRLNNPAYTEVTGTTGTSFDNIIPFIYNDEGLLLSVSMGQIRAGAAAANRMNALIVEAMDNTHVADDGYISADDARALNAYLVTNYAGEWRELHGYRVPATGEVTGYHSLQNNGLICLAYVPNAVNGIGGIYHLGFETTYAYNLVDEEGNKNISFSSLAYSLNTLLHNGFDLTKRFW